MPGLEPKYRCRVSPCETVPSADYYGQTTCDSDHDECAGMKLPTWYRNDTIDINDRCRVPVVRESAGDCEEGGTAFTDNEGATCDYEDLVFDRSVMRSTLIEEFQLVCGR